MRTTICGILVLLLGAGGLYGAEGPAKERLFASVDAPDRSGWTYPERWKEEQKEGKPVLRLMAGSGYPKLKVTGPVPTEGMVMLRFRYFSSGKPLVAGIGAWGSPTCVGATRPAGWQVEDLVFPATNINGHLSDGMINLFVLGGGADGPALNRIELLVPTAEQVLERYRAWVREGTDAAFAAARSPAFTEEPNGEAAVELAATPADRALGALPILRSYLECIYPGSVPKPVERAVTGTVMLPPGEFEVFQFGLHAMKDFGELSAELEGPVPAGLGVEICWLECAPVRVGSSRSSKFKIVPNRLWPKEIFPTCSAKSGESRAWYAIVRTDAKLKAGEYPLRIAVKNAGVKLFGFTCVVKVLPFTLPHSADIDKLFMVTDAGPVLDEATLRDLAEHGLNATASFDGYQPTNAQRKADFSAWDEYFARLKKHRLNSGFFMYLGNPKTGNAVKAGVGAEQFGLILQGLNERVKDGRYPKNFFLSIDEAVVSPGAFSQHKELYAQCKKDAPALRVLGCALDKTTNTVQYEGNADMLACNASFAENSAWCIEKGVLLNMYSSASFTFSGAAETRLGYGFFPWQHGSYAMNGWALRWFHGHPFNSLDTDVTDWASFFPNWTGGRPISTPCWEGIRQGINDQRYLAVLERLVKEGKSDGKLLEKLRKDGVGKVAEMRETVRGDTEFGVAAKNAPDLEIARALVIQEIIKATKASPGK